VPDREPLTFLSSDSGGDPAHSVPHTNGVVTTSGVTKTRRIRRRVIVAGAVVFVGLWAFALTYSVTAGGRSPERLDDPAARTVERACRDAQRGLEAIPQLSDRPTFAQRAARLTTEDAIFTQMINKLERLKPSQRTPATALTLWLHDWQRMVTARQNYANDLRTKGATAVFREPGNGIEAIPNKMNNWPLEQGTRTDNCNTGVLQLEQVDGPRAYGPGSKS
jgi:hypothetical protein